MASTKFKFSTNTNEFETLKEKQLPLFYLFPLYWPILSNLNGTNDPVWIATDLRDHTTSVTKEFGSDVGGFFCFM